MTSTLDRTSDLIRAIDGRRGMSWSREIFHNFCCMFVPNYGAWQDHKALVRARAALGGWMRVLQDQDQELAALDTRCTHLEEVLYEGCSGAG